MRLLTIAIAAVLAAAIASAPASAAFTITPIITPSGATIAAANLGQDGTVVGQSTDTVRPTVRRPDGSFEELPSIGGTRGAASAINASGTIAGGARTGANGASNRPYVRSAAGVTTVLPIPMGASLGSARAINDWGVVAGSYTLAGVEVAFTGSVAAGTSPLATPAGFDGASANAINAVGIVSGNATRRSDGAQAAVRWAADGTPTVLGSLLDTSSTGALNDAGINVGASSGFADPAGAIATVWLADGTVVNAGVLAGSSLSRLGGINNLGVAIGYSANLDFLGQEVDTRPMFWTLAGGLTEIDLDLSSLGLSIFSAYAINDAGQFLVGGFGSQGFITALISPAAAIPEPASWALLLTGFALIGAAQRHRRPAH